MQITPETEGGVYSNFVAVWHTAHEFTLDFCSTQPPQVDDSGDQFVPARVVSRVKIPPTMLFELLKALNTNMTNYEKVFGEIQQPGPPHAAKEEDSE